jgi:hypothetical protein
MEEDMGKKKRRKRQTANPQQPQWQPVSALPTLARHIDGMLKADREQYETLLEARPKPYILDDTTVNRVISVFTTTNKDLPLFDEQLRRWKNEQLTETQREEITRLEGQMQQVHTVVTAILNLADELKEQTIERQLAKSDTELAVETLFKMMSG